MKRFTGRYHKNIAVIVIILTLSGFLVLSQAAGLFDHLEFRTYDLRVNFFSASSRPSGDIILVLLDQESIDWGRRERGWGWPWPRAAYVEFIEYMGLGRAKALVFDVLFTEPSIYTQFLVDDDAAFAEAGRNYGRIVHTVFFSTLSGSYEIWPDDLNVPLFNPENFNSFIDNFDLSLPILRWSFDEPRLGAQFPIQEIRDSSGAVGSITGRPDSDLVFRRMHLFSIFDGRAVPALSAASLLAAGMTSDINFDPQKRNMRWGDYTIPVDKDGMALLRFRGPLDRYPNYSMSTVLKSAGDHAEGRVPLLPPENFENAYVFFGLYAPGLFDTVSSPVSSIYPGMGMHVTMLDNLLMGDFIRKIPGWLDALIAVSLIIMAALFVFCFRRVSAAVCGLAASMVILCFAGFLAFNAGFWMHMVLPFIAMILSFVSAILYNYVTEGRDKRFLKQAFSRIISPAMVEKIMEEPSLLKPGGEMRELSALFSDIKNYSAIASEFQNLYGGEGPGLLVKMLNLYLSEMSGIVLANNGTIDKYGGDSIVAFFGAPVPMEDHAVKACRSAVKMKKREPEITKKIMEPHGVFFIPINNLMEKNIICRERPLFTRVGINTGDMVAGFIGTPEKLDYTITGNAVNLASRLEGVNKYYGTGGILISEFTRERIGDEFILRTLSRVRVAGIPSPFRIFELLDIKEEASPGLIEMTGSWETAFGAFESRDFIRAGNIFTELFRRNPQDSAAEHFRDRCVRYTSSPPPAGWDGVDDHASK